MSMTIEDRAQVEVGLGEVMVPNKITRQESMEDE